MIVALVTATVIGATAAFSSANTSKSEPKKAPVQHYANFGPWCVSLHDGTPRFIATKQSCYSTKTVRDGKTYWPEVRVKHQRIPLDPAPGPRGPAGPAGKSIAGAAGKDGQSATVTQSGGCVTIHAANGDSTVCNGKDGTSTAGAKGEKGDPGPSGNDGTNGRDGTDGLGDGLRWFCWDGQHGHGFADGGDGSAPDCNGGTKAAIQVVTVGPVLRLK
jgi:hypothetical protein